MGPPDEPVAGCSGMREESTTKADNMGSTGGRRRRSSVVRRSSQARGSPEGDAHLALAGPVCGDRRGGAGGGRAAGTANTIRPKAMSTAIDIKRQAVARWCARPRASTPVKPALTDALSALAFGHGGRARLLTSRAPALSWDLVVGLAEGGAARPGLRPASPPGDAAGNAARRTVMDWLNRGSPPRQGPH